MTSLDVSSHEILVGSGDGRARLYDLRAGSLLTDTLGGSVSSVKFTRDGQCILASCVGKSLKLMDKANGEMLSEFKGHVNKDYKLDSCLDHTDQLVISGSEDSKVYLWDLVTGEVVGKLDHGANTGTVHSLAVHPARSFLVSAQRGSVTVWQDREKYEEDEEEEVVMSSANAFDMPPHWLKNIQKLSDKHTIRKTKLKFAKVFNTYIIMILCFRNVSLLKRTICFQSSPETSCSISRAVLFHSLGAFSEPSRNLPRGQKT